MKLDRPQLCAAAMLVCLVVAGCDRKAEERSKAAGEVLEGTISDAMIAPDRVRTEPPIAPRKAQSPADKGGKAKVIAGDDSAPDQSSAPESTPMPEASPTPKPPASEPAA